MSEKAFARIAARLRDLCDADREWLLGQLAPEDGRRLVEALRAQRQRVSAGNAAEGVVGPKGEATPPEERSEPWKRLGSAGVSEMRRVLADQPDWAIAIVVATRPWQWSQEFLAGLASERIRALRELAAELAGVKPRVREALLSEIAAKLERAGPKSSATEAFDAALQRAMEEQPIVARRRLERA